MSLSTGQKRKQTNGQVGHRKKHISFKKRKRAAAAYHSSSEEEDENDATQTANDGLNIPEGMGSSSSGEDEDGGVELPNLVLAKESQETDIPNNWQQVDDSEDGEDYEDLEDINNDDDDDDDDEEDEIDDENTDEDENAEIASEPGRSNTGRKIAKRNDPTQFATSISKILSSKLTTSKRSDPVLSRSKDASATAKELSEGKLEAKARRKLREEKKSALERAREKDVTGVSREDVSAGAVAEKERQLRKTAQRGVVKLFNAVRAAQVKGEETAREARLKGVVGADRRQEQVNEMSKKGFLDLLVEGGK